MPHAATANKVLVGQRFLFQIMH